MPSKVWSPSKVGQVAQGGEKAKFKPYGLRPRIRIKTKLSMPMCVNCVGRKGNTWRKKLLVTT